MVLLTFADNSKYNIPLEALQLIPYFKELPDLTDDSQNLDLSFNEIFTYNNIIRCISMLGSLNDSCKKLMDYLCIDINFHDKNEIKEMFNIDLTKVECNNVNAIILRCKLDHTYIIDNYERIFKLPVNVIKKCITKDNVNFQNKYNSTVLMYASSNGHTDIIKLLIEAGANVNFQNYDNNTALMFASEKGHTDIIKLLIEAGADINIQNKYNKTALMFASWNGHTEIVKLLKK